VKVGCSGCWCKYPAQSFGASFISLLAGLDEFEVAPMTTTFLQKVAQEKFHFHSERREKAYQTVIPMHETKYRDIASAHGTYVSHSISDWPITLLIQKGKTKSIIWMH
jgi:hypothetical protein